MKRRTRSLLLVLAAVLLVAYGVISELIERDVPTRSGTESMAKPQVASDVESVKHAPQSSLPDGVGHEEEVASRIGSGSAEARMHTVADPTAELHERLSIESARLDEIVQQEGDLYDYDPEIAGEILAELEKARNDLIDTIAEEDARNFPPTFEPEEDEEDYPSHEPPLDDDPAVEEHSSSEL